MIKKSNLIKKTSLAMIVLFLSIFSVYAQTADGYTKVGNVTIIGNKDIKREDIIFQLENCIPGRIFSEEGLKQDLDQIRQFYFEHGYISMQVKDSVVLNPVTGRKDITYTIIENKIFYINRIIIKGNVHIEEAFILWLLGIKPGDRFDGPKLRVGRNKLLGELGLFTDVNYDIENTTAPNKKNLVVKVVELDDVVNKQGYILQNIFNYTRAIEINPRDADAYFNRGVDRDKGIDTLAILDFTKAIEINPKFAQAYDHRGIDYFNQGNLTQALSDFTKAIEIYPKYLEAYSNRSADYFMLKEYDKAWADVYKVEYLGGTVDPKFIKQLKKDSGRDK